MALNLPRLQRTIAIVNNAGQPGLEFHRWWQSVAESIETAFANLEATVTAVAAAQAAATAANAAAAAADAAAATAQNAADAVTTEASLTNSYVTGLTLGATDAGSNASVSISAHTRVYGSGTSVSVNSGNLTGLSYSTTYYIYYDQASRLGGAVTYQSTTSQATAAQTGNRHFVGAVKTPAAAAGPTSGYGVSPPGVGNVYIP